MSTPYYPEESYYRTPNYPLQYGGHSPYPPPSYPPYYGPRKKITGIIILIIGVILLIIGSIITVYYWTYDEYEDYEDPEVVSKKLMNDEYQESDTIKMIGTVKKTDELYGQNVIYIEDFEMEMPEFDEYGVPTGNTVKEMFPIVTNINCAKGDTVIITANYGGTDIDVEIVEEDETMPGIIGGISILIIGIILMILGIVIRIKSRPAQTFSQEPSQKYSPPPQQPYYTSPQQPNYSQSQQPYYTPTQQPQYPPPQQTYPQPPQYSNSDPNYPPPRY